MALNGTETRIRKKKMTKFHFFVGYAENSGNFY